MTTLGDFISRKTTHSFAWWVTLFECLGRNSFSCHSLHLLDGEIATKPILSSLELSLHCGKSAYPLLVLFDEHLFSSFSFVSYKQTSSAPSHAKSLFLSHSQMNPANFRIVLNIGGCCAFRVRHRHPDGSLIRRGSKRWHSSTASVILLNPMLRGLEGDRPCLTSKTCIKPLPPWLVSGCRSRGNADSLQFTCFTRKKPLTHT